MIQKIMPAALVILAISGCSTTPDYGCKAPDGVTCKSITEVYRSTDGATLTVASSVNKEGDVSHVGKYTPTLATPKNMSLPPIKPGDPVRIEPRILRVWLAPWEDENEVFHDQAYIYVVVDHGRWLVSQNRRMIEHGWRSRDIKPPSTKIEPDKKNETERSGTQTSDPSAANRAAIRALSSAESQYQK